MTDSIGGIMATLTATMAEVGTTLVDLSALKAGAGGLVVFSEGLSKALKFINQCHMSIPAAVASFALLATTISSIKYAGGLVDGLKLVGMKIANLPTTIGTAKSAMGNACSAANASANAFTDGPLGLVGAPG